MLIVEYMGGDKVGITKARIVLTRILAIVFSIVVCIQTSAFAATTDEANI
jgi:hypothetical protein